MAGLTNSSQRVYEWVKNQAKKKDDAILPIPSLLLEWSSCSLTGFNIFRNSTDPVRPLKKSELTVKGDPVAKDWNLDAWTAVVACTWKELPNDCRAYYMAWSCVVLYSVVWWRMA